MKVRRAIAGALVTLAAAAPGPSLAAANAPSAECAAIDYLLRQARTDFPALKRKKFERATCSYRKQAFRCEWAFPGDTFAAAESQASRLARCAAGLPGAEPLVARKGETRFQLNPETAVLIRDPKMVSGSWTLRLEITTTAQWD